MIVVDTNLLVHLHTRGADTRLAEQVLVRDPEWLAPMLWRSEFRNVAVNLVRARLMEREDAVAAVGAAEDRMVGREYPVPSAQVLALALASGCSADDCEFVSLARQLGARLVTGDAQVLTAFPDTAVSPRDFVA
jgi:predicted nucleic acid-binding protein